MIRRAILALGLAALSVPASAPTTSLAAGTQVEEAPGTPSDDGRGFLYGRVKTESGTVYRGFIRWGTEEAFWDDLFHSVKRDLPAYDDVDPDLLPRRRELRRGRLLIFKWEVDVKGDGEGSSRQFIARFGDIQEIEPRGKSKAEVRMKSGRSYQVSGYSNDVGGRIEVRDASLGKTELLWDRIDSIEFMPAPAGESPGARRLYGTVESDAGEFRGFIQWDMQECLSGDLLDGDTEDGRLSIEMGRIRSIERRGRGASTVKLDDGRELVLRGTNDVNHENRGIMVEDERYGRVTVTWDAFDRVSFSPAPGSGRAYDDFPPSGQLTGTVTAEDGRRLRGRIVLDLDEAEGWEMLNGSRRDVLFNIPLNRIASIKPEGSSGSLVEWKGGEKLELEDGQDVSESNAGLLVYPEGGGKPTYLRWEDVQLIRFGD